MFRHAATAVAVLLLASACGSEAARDPAAGPTTQGEGQIAVARAITGSPPRRDVVLIDLEGKVVTELASEFALAGPGSWSPDGRLFAYAGTSGRPSFDGTDKTDIYVVDPAGTKPRRLTESGQAVAPVWAPDGSTIVFAEVTPGPRFKPTATIWSIGVDGTDKRRLLAPVRGQTAVPTSFTPDGSHLAFTRHPGFDLGFLEGEDGARIPNLASIHLLDLASLEVSRLVDRAAEGVFSPDGRLLAYSTDRDENGQLSYGDTVSYANELYLLDVATGETTRVTKTHDLNEGAPSWSPDGRLIAYSRGEVIDNAEGTSILTTRPDGSCQRRVAFDPGLDVWYTSPVWRPGQAASAEAETCRPDSEPQAVPLAGNMSLTEARSFEEFELYWLGPQHKPFVLSSISKQPSSGPRGSGSQVNLHYGDIQMQLSHACARVPSDIDFAPSKQIRARGVDVFFFDPGHAELVTGETTIVLFAEEFQIMEAIRALRPVADSAPPGPDDELPAPAPGALEGQLRC